MILFSINIFHHFAIFYAEKGGRGGLKGSSLKFSLNRKLNKSSPHCLHCLLSCLLPPWTCRKKYRHCLRITVVADSGFIAQSDSVRLACSLFPHSQYPILLCPKIRQRREDIFGSSSECIRVQTDMFRYIRYCYRI
jgi:hypothetical protein